MNLFNYLRVKNDNATYEETALISEIFNANFNYICAQDSRWLDHLRIEFQYDIARMIINKIAQRPTLDNSSSNNKNVSLLLEKISMNIDRSSLPPELKRVYKENILKTWNKLNRNNE